MDRNAWVRTVASLGAAAIAVGLVLSSRRDDSPPLDEVRTPSPREETELCAQRLRKLGRALRLYAADNDGAFPVGETPAAVDAWLPKRLEDRPLAAADLRCPTSEPGGPPYVYHCYEALGEGSWSRWMAPEHLVTADSEPDTWLAADCLERDGPGPHSDIEKAFNYLTADGRVRFHTGRPRDVYK